jgi:hypothetical protein
MAMQSCWEEELSRGVEAVVNFLGEPSSPATGRETEEGKRWSASRNIDEDAASGRSSSGLDSTRGLLCDATRGNDGEGRRWFTARQAKKQLDGALLLEIDLN